MIIQNEERKKHAVPRITTRVLVGADSGAAATAVWEQWLAPGGFIPLHYHEVEEVLELLAGSVEVTMGDKVAIARAPATVLVPARLVHAFKQVGSDEAHLLAFFPTADPVIFAPDGSVRPLPWDDRQTTGEPGV